MLRPKGDTVIGKIEHKVPLPDRAMPGIYPFDKMRVGDSFFIDWGRTSNSLSKMTNRVRASANSYARRANRGKKKSRIGFVVRLVDGGTRVWRTA